MSFLVLNITSLVILIFLGFAWFDRFVTLKVRVLSSGFCLMGLLLVFYADCLRNTLAAPATSGSFSFISFKNSIFEFYFSFDAVSIYFALLTGLLYFLSSVVSLNRVFYRRHQFYSTLFLITWLLVLTFMSNNLLMFYLFFEASLIPMYYLIVTWGSRERRLHAAYMYFFYTLLGSIFLITGILIVLLSAKTLTTPLLYHTRIDDYAQRVIWVLLFIGFAIKVPLPPFHTWLPEAHVEAPTAGSVILAGVLLKVGTFGMYKFIVPVVPQACTYFSSVVFIISVWAVFYAALTALAQLDMKKIIAYSSVSHMGLVTAGLFSSSASGVVGSVYMMLSHGLVSSALFIFIGVLYERYGSRNILYYSGLTTVAPILMTFGFIFVLANIGFPGTSGFVGEFLCLSGTVSVDYFTTVVLCFSIVITAAYSLWFFNRVAFGPIGANLVKFRDVDKYEFYVLFVLGFLVILFGVYPMCILRVIEAPITFLLVSIRDQGAVLTFFDKANLLSYSMNEFLDDYAILRSGTFEVPAMERPPAEFYQYVAELNERLAPMRRLRRAGFKWV